MRRTHEPLLCTWSVLCSEKNLIEWGGNVVALGLIVMKSSHCAALLTFIVTQIWPINSAMFDSAGRHSIECKKQKSIFRPLRRRESATIANNSLHLWTSKDQFTVRRYRLHRFFAFEVSTTDDTCVEWTTEGSKCQLFSWDLCAIQGLSNKTKSSNWHLNALWDVPHKNEINANWIKFVVFTRESNHISPIQRISVGTRTLGFNEQPYYVDLLTDLYSGFSS